VILDRREMENLQCEGGRCCQIHLRDGSITTEADRCQKRIAPDLVRQAQQHCIQGYVPQIEGEYSIRLGRVDDAGLDGAVRLQHQPDAVRCQGSLDCAHVHGIRYRRHRHRFGRIRSHGRCEGCLVRGGIPLSWFQRGAVEIHDQAIGMAIAGAQVEDPRHDARRRRQLHPCATARWGNPDARDEGIVRADRPAQAGEGLVHGDIIEIDDQRAGTCVMPHPGVDRLVRFQHQPGVFRVQAHTHGLYFDRRFRRVGRGRQQHGEAGHGGAGFVRGLERTAEVGTR
jgi:hypothetical protein